MSGLRHGDCLGVHIAGEVLHVSLGPKQDLVGPSPLLPQVKGSNVFLILRRFKALLNHLPSGRPDWNSDILNRNITCEQWGK